MGAFFFSPLLMQAVLFFPVRNQIGSCAISCLKIVLLQLWIMLKIMGCVEL